MNYVIWFVLLYLALGVAVTLMLSQTPYADNPWWLTTLIWPLFIWGMVH